MAFLAPPVFLGLAALAVPGPDPPDPAREEDGADLPVADVRAADPVPDRAAAEDPRHRAADGASRGAGAHRARVRAAVPRGGPAATTIGPGARELVVLLDNSYSLAYADRWDRAKAAARDAISKLGPTDRGIGGLFRRAPTSRCAPPPSAIASIASFADRDAVSGRDALRSRAESGRQHPGGVAAAAA